MDPSCIYDLSSWIEVGLKSDRLGSKVLDTAGKVMIGSQTNLRGPRLIPRVGMHLNFPACFGTSLALFCMQIPPNPPRALNQVL